jgi:hypothetical protein
MRWLYAALIIHCVDCSVAESYVSCNMVSEILESEKQGMDVNYQGANITNFLMSKKRVVIFQKFWPSLILQLKKFILEKIPLRWSKNKDALFFKWNSKTLNQKSFFYAQYMKNMYMAKKEWLPG